MTTADGAPAVPIADLFIDGKWCEGATGERFPVTDPSDGTTVAEFAVASDADCDAALEAAASAFPAWSATSPRARSEVLRRAFEILTAEADILAEIIVRENGKAWSDARAEATYATEFFRWFAEEAVRVPGEYRLSPAADKRIIVTHQPIGVSVLITPWNFPAAMATRKLAPALAAGCTTVLKPARETPLTAAYIVDAIARAGVPAGVVNLVTPKASGPAVTRMLAHPAVRKLSFTGSTEVGRTLLKQAADRVVSTSMELGGNAPLIVLPGADLDMAVEGAYIAKMRNGGSACTSANRFYVHDSLHDDFVEKLGNRLAAVVVGSGLDPANEVGALVSLYERDKVAELVDTAVGEGARVAVGGTKSETGAFYAPTLLTDVRHGSTINRSEIFGPVSAIVRFTEVDEAVSLANDSEAGLMAYVFGEEGQSIRLAQRLNAGMVAVNRGVVSDPAAPFGGTKQSGLGREGSSEGILEFLETQYIAVDA
ncbi:NAD-dependent succinate-semialdehyde dehydrogenase [Streptomyces sp. JV176]|uniref:NAD-dependent succinate-semialdehyde dehydrogenase n=1 Tax=Streptomyces sp. JV176 TaxID=858630 RepID=UPI002E7776FB|nr:NAD-dependent succinate-semialdehyde dehydrogenase [Streptomyces sp. JV176]MEE1799492.1 NAD-dependent succinate-semialdehyde dehydrogenase [Streptomyces sp. JV176]